MPMLGRKLVLVWLCSWWLLPASAQWLFHMNSSNGLCTSSLTDLTCDHLGNMWIGSYSGLMKYSGTHVRCFEKIGSDNDAISGPEMHSISEDRCGMIWIGTTAGLNSIDPITFEVKHFPIKSPIPGVTSIGYIYSVFADRYDFIWFSTDVALFRFDSQTGNYVVIPVREDEHGIPSYNMMYNGYVETDEGIWMCTGAGIVFYEFASGKFHHQFYNPQHKVIFYRSPKPFSDQSDLRMDSQGNLWYVKAHDQLARYNIAHDQLDAFPVARPVGTWYCCYSIGIDSKDNVWLGRRHAGVSIFQPASQTWRYLRALGPNKLIQSDYIHAIERGRDGKMFVSSDGGLDIIDLYATSIREYQLSGAPDFVNLKYESGDLSVDPVHHQVYIPFYKLGMVRFIEGTDSFWLVRANEVDAARISFMYADQGENYLGVNGNLQLMQEYEGELSLSSKMLLPDSISKTNGEVIWCYTDAPASYYVKKSSGRIFHIHHDTIKVMKGAGFKANMCLSPDHGIITYISHNDDLVRINLTSNRADTLFLQDKLSKVDFSFSNARHIEDDGHSIWMTGQNGVLRYDYKRDTLFTYGIREGLSHTFTFSMVRDRDSNIWVGNIGGVDRFSHERNRFETVFRSRTNTYMDAFGSAICTPEGTLYFHFGNKLVEIHPDSMQLHTTRDLTLRIEEVMVNGKHIDWTEHRALNHLKYDQNRLTFLYDLPWFDNEEQIRFSYKLNERDWIENAGRNQIDLDGLTNGKYVLQVRAIPVTGSEAKQPLVIAFRIMPPFWKSWWFILSGIVLAAGMAYLFYRHHIQRIRQQTALEIQMIRLKSTALKAQMNPHFVFNSLNAIQECVVTGKVDEAYAYLSKFSKLLRLILEYSDKPTVSLNSELEVLNLYLLLEQLRFKSDFHFDIQVDQQLDADEVFIPPMLLQPHIENAVWHGLRFKEGEKFLQIKMAELKPDYLRITVQDNGIGRSASSANKKEQLAGNRHRSMGTKLSQDQIALLQQRYPVSQLNIEDLTDEYGQAVGTKVIFILPMMKPSSSES